MTALSKILLIDDDAAIHKLLERVLEENYKVYNAATGVIAEQMIKEDKFDIVIFDLYLEHENGMSILKEFQSKNLIENSKIFILTSDRTTEMEIEGHSIGIDEYVKKPIVPEVFKAIVDKHVKSLSESNNTNLSYGNISVDLSSLIVSLNSGEVSKEVTLTSKEFQILVSLIQNAGEVLTRESLYNSIWHKQTDNLQRTLDMHVSSLRKKLGDTGRYIKTIRSAGYKIDMAA
jgi:DNA-binding response OmpR family regulator